MMLGNVQSTAGEPLVEATLSQKGACEHESDEKSKDDACLAHRRELLEVGHHGVVVTSSAGPCPKKPNSRRPALAKTGKWCFFGRAFGLSPRGGPRSAPEGPLRGHRGFPLPRARQAHPSAGRWVHS